MEGKVADIVKAFVKAVNEGDEFSAYVNFTRLRNLGLSEDDLLTKGYINAQPTKEVVRPTLRKKTTKNKSRRSTR